MRQRQLSGVAWPLPVVCHQAFFTRQYLEIHAYLTSNWKILIISWEKEIPTHYITIYSMLKEQRRRKTGQAFEMYLKWCNLLYVCIIPRLSSRNGQKLCRKKNTGSYTTLNSKAIGDRITAWKLAACLSAKEVFQTISEQSHYVKQMQVQMKYSYGLESKLFFSSLFGKGFGSEGGPWVYRIL